MIKGVKGLNYNRCCCFDAHMPVFNKLLSVDIYLPVLKIWGLTHVNSNVKLYGNELKSTNTPS